jgi:UrcA family protein
MNVRSLQARMIGSAMALAGVLAFATAAHAGDAGGEPVAKVGSVVVRYADLDLSSSDDAKVLYERLSSAAKRACGKAPMAWDREGREDWDKCRERRLQKAVDQVGNPNVNALHAVHKDEAKVS